MSIKDIGHHFNDATKTRSVGFHTNSIYPTLLRRWDLHNKKVWSISFIWERLW